MTGRNEVLCSHPALRNFEDCNKRAARYEAAVPLAWIIIAVRTGTNPALLGSDLDALDEAFARHRIDNLTGTVRAYRPLTVAGEHPVIQAWICPASRPCSRPIPADETTPPVCALTDRPVTLVEV